MNTKTIRHQSLFSWYLMRSSAYGLSLQLLKTHTIFPIRLKWPLPVSTSLVVHRAGLIKWRSGLQLIAEQLKVVPQIGQTTCQYFLGCCAASSWVNGQKYIASNFPIFTFALLLLFGVFAIPLNHQYTVKPVFNDHLYDQIYYLWFIQ